MEKPWELDDIKIRSEGIATYLVYARTGTTEAGGDGILEGHEPNEEEGDTCGGGTKEEEDLNEAFFTPKTGDEAGDMVGDRTKQLGDIIRGTISWVGGYAAGVHTGYDKQATFEANCCD
eukprot:13319260-Heterocapsa_arctica.AAC.1